jgi:hypothetical protein
MLCGGRGITTAFIALLAAALAVGIVVYMRSKGAVP